MALAAPAADSSQPDSHGSREHYRRGCRCLPCSTAHATYRRARRLLDAADPWTDAAPARDHLRQLGARGIGKDRIAALARLTPDRVHRIRSGAVPRLRSSVSARLLALHPTPAPGVLVASGRARQFLSWFQKEGFTLDAIAARVGLDVRTVACSRSRVTLHTAVTLSAFRRALAD